MQLLELNLSVGRQAGCHQLELTYLVSWIPVLLPAGLDVLVLNFR